MKANPLTEEQARDARARGEAVRVMREQHGMSLDLWQVPSITEVPDSEEDLRYRELRERWDELRLKIKGDYGDVTEPLAALRELGAALAGAWRFAWAVSEIAYSEWPFPPRMHSAKPYDVIGHIRSGEYIDTINKVSGFRNVLSNTQPAGFDFSFSARGISIVDALDRGIKRETQAFLYLLKMPSEPEKIEALAIELGGSKVAEALKRARGMRNAEQEQSGRRVLACLAAIEASIVTRRPLDQLYTDAFIFPERSLDVPKAVRWTTIEPPRTGAVRGYPINARGQLDSLKIAREAAEAVGYVNTWRMWRELQSYDPANVRGEIASWQKKYGTLGSIDSYALLDLGRSNLAEAASRGMNVGWAYDGIYALGAISQYVKSLDSATLDEALTEVYDQIGEGQRAGNAALTMATAVYLQKGRTPQAAALCAKLAVEIGARIMPSVELYDEIAQLMKGS